MTALLGALKYIPASTARKALEKVNPGFKNYFAKSAAYGLDINHALDYLTDRFQSESQRAHKQHLEQGERNKTLRPDEAASKAQIDNAEIPLRALKSAASFAGGGLLGGQGREQPQQEEQEIPENGPFPPGRAELGKTKGAHGPGAGIIPQEYFGNMGPLEQQQQEAKKQNLFQNPTPMQKESGIIPKTREESINKYNEMQKRKKLFQELQQEFGEYYGQPQGASPKSNLLKMTQEGLSILNQLKNGR